ncbi:hypothetical protein C0J08_15165 [Marinomonas sp. CT5]|uniref:hypothetical protein n=1 Tax=Marinomonas sp. CT5 TaxID=2066133 RepID=UPI001BAF3BDF|nr:hypothetical protein [Marinomonas sp. CT5]QUX96655.1 hypothetical protein C0J08_15165 [Marinomonas sp. CT5]
MSTSKQVDIPQKQYWRTWNPTPLTPSLFLNRPDVPAHHAVLLRNGVVLRSVSTDHWHDGFCNHDTVVAAYCYKN